ncbi:MAG: TonB-dependent receptor [Desulfamplus sp.]|nr:TonB-dependent receptor [Desulfamplus sp.]
MKKVNITNLKTKQITVRTLIVFVVAIFALVITSTLNAQEKAGKDSITSLEDIEVTSEKIITPTKETSETVYTGSEITKKGMEIQGDQAKTSVYESLDILPGISVETPDPYGLAAEQRTVRVRGVRGYLGSMTVEGVPNWGGNPMGPREYIYDTENFESISVYKGAVPSDFGTGVGARGGAIELKPKWSDLNDKIGFTLSESGGTDSYSRTFLGFDSGKIPNINTGVSMSYSYTDADKWKGPGDLGPRNNFNMMLTQPVGDKGGSGGDYSKNKINSKDAVKVWFNYNDLSQNLYKALSYQETQNLSANYKNDFNSTLTGVKNQDIYYYDYNKGDYNNLDIMSVIPINLNDSLSLSFKPYYSTEDTEILGGVASQGGLIQKRTRDIERYGLITQLEGELMSSDLSSVIGSLGYAFESNDMKIITQNLDPLTLANKGYGMYTENDGEGIVHSPFMKLAGNIDKFDWQAGLKYFSYTDPASQGYTSAVPNYELVKAADLYREEKEYEKVLPTVGMGYNFSESLNIYTSYGKNFIRPYSYVPIITLYNTNRSTFQTAGVTLNDMFNGYNMELSDNFELGARFRSGLFEVMPAFFYSTHENLLTTIYDPRVNLSYQQNVGEATGYGLDLETNLFITSDLSLFFNPTWTSMTYNENLTYQRKTLNSKDKQIVDTPEFMAKTGMIYRHDFNTNGSLEVVPMLKYIGKRYGDVEHQEEVDDFITADLNLKYSRKVKWFASSYSKKENSNDGTTMNVALQLQNLFDEEYIASISASDDSRAGSTGYYVGSPFTTILSVSFEY